MPNHGLITVEKENKDGTVDGQWLEGVCASTLEQAKERMNIYKDDRHPVAVISVCSGWIGVGHRVTGVAPLAQTHKLNRE